ncbi:hypothetical protein LLG95_09585 [bacterium]|nr:hypothetical protein [bacterium]
MNNFDEKTPLEFDALLEALWAGELDADGQARLEALAASDPALADCLSRERALTSMLAGHGPNRAPKGLAGAVFARMNAELPAPQPEPERPRAQVITIPAWFTPTLRWGLAVAVILVCFTQLMWLIVHDRMGGQTIQVAYDVAPLPNPKTNGNAGLASYTPPKATVKPELARRDKKATESGRELAQATGADKARPASPKPAPKEAEKLIAAVRTPSPTPAPTSKAAETQAAPIEKELAKAIESSVKTTDSKVMAAALPAGMKSEAAAAAVESQEDLIATPGQGVAKPRMHPLQGRSIASLPQPAVKGKNAQVIDRAAAMKQPATAGSIVTASAEDKIIMRIVLPPASDAVEGAMQAPHASAMQPASGAVRAFGQGVGGQRGAGTKTFAGGVPSTVQVEPPQKSSLRGVSATPRPTLHHELTHIQIQQVISACGGLVKGVQQIRAVPAIWRIDASIPQANMAGFIERLGQLGIKAGETENAEPNQFAIIQGEDLMRGKTEPTTATQRVAGRPATIPLTVLVDEGRK